MQISVSEMLFPEIPDLPTLSSICSNMRASLTTLKSSEKGGPIPSFPISLACLMSFYMILPYSLLTHFCTVDPEIEIFILSCPLLYMPLHLNRHPFCHSYAMLSV